MKDCSRGEFPVFLPVAHQTISWKVALAPKLSMSKICHNISPKTGFCENACWSSHINVLFSPLPPFLPLSSFLPFLIIPFQSPFSGVLGENPWNYLKLCLSFSQTWSFTGSQDISHWKKSGMHICFLSHCHLFVEVHSTWTPGSLPIIP